MPEHTGVHPRWDSSALCQCWCERSVAIVPLAMVRVGLTVSCGRRGCHAPPQAEAA